MRKGGGRIDTNGFDVKINQPLLAPQGNGILTVPVTRGGSGYLGAPWFEIAGATATAELVDGAIKNILIADPGNDFQSAPTVSILGGGSGSGLALGTPVLGANASGGLIKSGSATLTLGSRTALLAAIQDARFLQFPGHREDRWVGETPLRSDCVEPRLHFLRPTERHEAIPLDRLGCHHRGHGNETIAARGHDFR